MIERQADERHSQFMDISGTFCRYLWPIFCIPRNDVVVGALLALYHVVHRHTEWIFTFSGFLLGGNSCWAANRKSDVWGVWISLWIDDYQDFFYQFVDCADVITGAYMVLWREERYAASFRACQNTMVVCNNMALSYVDGIWMFIAMWNVVWIFIDKSPCATQSITVSLAGVFYWKTIFPCLLVRIQCMDAFLWAASS